MGSNRCRVGVLGTVEGCFVLGGRDVVAVGVEPVVVEPVHPGERGELEVGHVVPAGGVGVIDAGRCPKLTVEPIAPRPAENPRELANLVVRAGTGRHLRARRGLV